MKIVLYGKIFSASRKEFFEFNIVSFLKSPRTINDDYNNLFMYKHKLIRGGDMSYTNKDLNWMSGNWYVSENNSWEDTSRNEKRAMIPYPPKNFSSQQFMIQNPNLESLESFGGWTYIWTVNGMSTWIYIVFIDELNREITGYVPIESQSGTYAAYAITISLNQIQGFVKDNLATCINLELPPTITPTPSDPKPPINYTELLKCIGFWTYIWTRRGAFWISVKDLVQIKDSSGNIKEKLIGCSWTGGGGAFPIEEKVPIKEISDYYKYENYMMSNTYKSI